tara:strand:- start:118 stop:711 length:594 start_codon:yes stop_codon:yes gene_type:complete
MATRKKNNTNKANHGMRTYESLLSMTPSSNMNAALIKPKFTPLPSSKFSSRFQTKGTKSPIKKDVLISPKSTDTAYRVERIAPRPVLDPVPPRLRMDMQRAMDELARLNPRSPEYTRAQLRVNEIRRAITDTVPARSLAAYDQYQLEKTSYDTEVSTKARLLTTDTTQFNKDIGTRTVAMSKSKGSSRGSRGPNRVL